MIHFNSGIFVPLGADPDAQNPFAIRPHIRLMVIDSRNEAGGSPPRLGIAQEDRFEVLSLTKLPRRLEIEPREQVRCRGVVELARQRCELSSMLQRGRCIGRHRCSYMHGRILW